ncbi:N-6 DNA methylase [Methyloversatilis discipulorum]|uniref:N-6 DNA methylase n=1 Tax=Methyloversatilis discipulorum TaxID=1119528 RepID=UPI001A365BDF|nr:N-6 DNA methylase [Methyloversatilis discipulorum]MBL8469237.1 N-6 DNA methylase [Methyloversatilis discipulorum]
MSCAIASALVSAVISAAETSRNEAQLRHELEKRLEQACSKRSIPWTPFQLERALKAKGKPTKFADVAHGAVVIEYEPPKSFGGRAGSKAIHARQQAEEYAKLISIEEGRDLREYVLIAWDGAHITFGCFDGATAAWEDVVAFDKISAERLLAALESNGRPLVHPQLLQTLVGPDSEYGTVLIPKLYASICIADASVVTTKTKMLFSEWRRLFSQVVGFQPAHMKKLLSRQEISHEQPYQDNPAAYLFALNTYIAIIAKVVAACALPNASQDVLAHNVPVADRLRIVETGELFENAGILNMLSGDFFSWYLDDGDWLQYEVPLSAMLGRLGGVDFTVSKKHADTTRDLFKGIYERFIPREVRHALGEFYTPDWLAEHGMDLLEWQPSDSLTDPTCGSGTFLLEAIRRRRKVDSCAKAQTLLAGIHGIDLNPLAVLAAKGSLAVFLSPHLDPAHPIRLPVYLADAVHPASVDFFSNYSHILYTEVGPRQFSVPERMINHPDFFRIFAKIRMLIDADYQAERICSSILADLQVMGLNTSDVFIVSQTVRNLVELHDQGWNGIWCSILADRFAAGAIPRSSHICGNPPWIRWSNLPKDYAQSIQQHCRGLGVFSSDKWVGGIESDISTVITYQAVKHYLAHAGRLGFFLPGSVFTTESSAGFRRFSIDNNSLQCRVLVVEDYQDIKPFDGVSNHPTFLILQRDEATVFPVPYNSWTIDADSHANLRSYASADQFRRAAKRIDGVAVPVPGGDGTRPWLIGSTEAQAVFSTVFSAAAKPEYKARKGVTTDRNGIFWVHATGAVGLDLVTVRNAADIGKTKGIPQITATVESRHLFPLLRGRGVAPFNAVPESDLRILVPQRGMHGDPDLAAASPHTFRFLNRFKNHLEQRSSLKRFQKGQAFYSLWSTGNYTFAPFKVLWREMGGSFAAAYIGSTSTEYIGEKVVVPDHKLYFIPVESEAEAAYLTGFLNAPTIARAVSAYAAQLSLGASVAEYLNIPKFDETDRLMNIIGGIARNLTNRSENIQPSDLSYLDVQVRALLGI